MTSENSGVPSFVKPKNKSAIGRFFTSPVALIRLAAIWFIALVAGHLTGYPWTSAGNSQELRLTETMKSVNYIFAGAPSSYWHLYFGWALWVAVLLVTIAGMLWLLSDLALIAPHRVGAITGLLSASCLVLALMSFHFFYIPPSIMLCVMFIILMAASVQLLRKT